MTTDLLDRRPNLPAVVDDVTRREFILAGAGALLLTACGADGATEASDPASTDTWSFTDDRDVTVTLPRRPQRLAMQEDAAGALLPYGIRPAMVFGNAPLAESPQFEGVDLAGIEEVGISFGVINLEQLAALDPDVILVPYSRPASDDVTWMGFENETQFEQAGEIAPIVAISVTHRPYSEMMVRFEDLAGALGADLSAPDVARMREDFEARAELTAAAEAEPGLLVVEVSTTEDLVYIGSATVSSEMLEYQALGLTIYDAGAEGFEVSPS